MKIRRQFGNPNKNHSNLLKRHIHFVKMIDNAITKEEQSQQIQPSTEEMASCDSTIESTKKPSFISKQKKAHRKDIEKKQSLLTTATEKKEEIKDSLLSEKDQIKALKSSLKEQRKQYKQTKNSLSHVKKDIKKAKKKNYGLLSCILISLFFIISIFLFFVVKWVFRTWPNLQITELVYQAKVGIAGTSTDIIHGFILQTIVPTVLFLPIVIAIMVLLAYSSKLVRRIGKGCLCLIACCLIITSGTTFENRLELIDYLKSQTGTEEDFIASHYVDPAETEITFPETKRNLICIYLESMEVTYANESVGGAFGEEDLIPNLTQLSNDNENFSGDNETLNGAISLPNTTWTSGGLFASTSGLPLQINMADGSNMDSQESFFAGTTVLGDILKENGYRNYFACGSYGEFGGRQLYFTTHGDYEIHDIVYNREVGRLDDDYYVWWGFEDEKLIEYTKEDLTEIASSDEPFNYTMLTVDTHFEDGYVCDLCQNEHGDNQYANVMTCSDRQVTELVSWIQEQDWYENTTIVITGDHPTMDSDFCAEVDSSYQRKVYYSFINANPVENNSSGYRTFSTMDTFPTIIASLGATIDGNRLGLGTNLYSGLPTFIEMYGLDTMSTAMKTKSEFMSDLADINLSRISNSQGYHPSATITLDSFTNNIASFTVKDVFCYEGDYLQSLRMIITESNGNVLDQTLSYQGDGVYEGAYTLSQDFLDDAHLELYVTSISKDSENTYEELFTDYYGNLQLISSTQVNFETYLNDLNKIDLNRYTLLFTTQGDVKGALSQNEKDLLIDLGASNLISGKGDVAFTVISGTDVYAKNGSGYIRDMQYLNEDTPFIISSSTNSEDPSSICIGWGFQEYCPQSNGINVVIYDTYNQCVVQTASFDTNLYNPEGTLTSTKPGLLENSETITLSDVSGVGSPWQIVGVIYDTEDESYYKELNFILDSETNTYSLTFNMSKKELKTKNIKVYAKYSDFTYRYINSIHLQ